MTADVGLGRHEAAQFHPPLDADSIVFKRDLRVLQAFDFFTRNFSSSSLRMDAVISPLSARVTRTS